MNISQNSYLKRNKGITLIALVVTIIILIILAGISINLVLGENGIIQKAKQTSEMQMKAQMKETLILAIQELLIEKSGDSTLDDVTQKWIEKTITEYTCTITEDASIEGKKVTMQKDGKKAKFVIDEKLNITEAESNGVEFSYEAISRQENNVNIVITIDDVEGVIKEIICQNGNKITTNGKNEIQIDYIVELGKEYKFIIVTNEGEEKEENILITDYYYSISKSLDENLSIDNAQIKASYNKSYEANIIAKEDYTIDTLIVTMGDQTIETDKTTGKIYIEKVTDEIKIIATSKKLEIEVSEIIIGTTTTATTSVDDYSQVNGTKLYINFDATLLGGKCTITPSVPYEITTLGTYKFKAIGTCNGKEVTKDIEVKVNKYQIYEIRTPDDLQNIKNNLSGVYYIMNDIDMEGYNFTSIGSYTDYFTGILDGQGYTISNLTIRDTTTKDTKNTKIGLFRQIKNATIRNVLFENVDISSQNNSGVGTIAGYTNEINIVENVGITGEIYSDSAGKIGSFYGNASSSNNQFKNCYARTTLSSGSNYDVGGFVGAGLINITVENSYWSGIINAKGRIGSFKANTDNGNAATDWAPVLTNCYYNKTLFNLTTPESVLGNALTTEEFANASNFTGWDFENTWTIVDGYPELKIFIKD